jgi:transketolase
MTYGIGLALGAKLDHQERGTYVLLSDAECNEGCVWEAAAFAAQQQLNKLTAIVDLNGQQAFGYTKDVLDMRNMAERWRAFGWDARVVDGHDETALKIELLRRAGNQPTVLVAQTTFGKGVSFMEGQIPWHYLPMNEQQFDQAMQEVS